MTKTTTGVLLCLAALGAAALAGCGGDTTTDGGLDGEVLDSGSDGGRDLGPDMNVDGGVDLGTDAGEDLGVDAGEDLGVDAGDDLGVDAGDDLGVDAGDDLGVDMGDVDLGFDMGDVDLGVDMGFDAGDVDMGFDMGVDGGPPPPPPGVFVRAVNLVSNYSVANVSFCLDVNGTSLEAYTPAYNGVGVPFPGGTDYHYFDPGILDPSVDAFVANIDDINAFGYDCSSFIPFGGVPLTSVTLPAGTFATGHTYTVAWVGLYDDGSGLPAICGAGFGSACPASATAKIVVLTDDITPPATGTKTRIVHAIPNTGNLDFCWDPDGAGAMPAQDIALNVPYGTAAAYANPAAITGGVFSMYAAGGTCAAHAGSPLFTETVPLAMPPAGVAPFGVTTLAAGVVTSTYAVGVLPAASSVPPSLVPLVETHL